MDRGSDFGAWRTQWNPYVSLSGLSAKPPAKQVQALMLCFSLETLTIVENLGFTTQQLKHGEAIISAIKRFIDGHINESVEQCNFHSKVVKPLMTS